jgi:hypothetical protein
MNCTEPVLSGSSTPPNVVASNQAVRVAAGPRRDRTARQVPAMKLPKPIRERPSIAANAQTRTSQEEIASKSVAAGSTAPTKDRRRAMPERLVTVQEAGEMLNTGERRFVRMLVAVVFERLADFPPSHPEDLIFRGPKGAALRRTNFDRSARLPDSVAGAGLPESFRFHDLRHTRNTLAASSGGERAGADASDGVREYARRIDLSARHQQPGSRDCRCD